MVLFRLPTLLESRSASGSVPQQQPTGLQQLQQLLTRTVSSRRDSVVPQLVVWLTHRSQFTREFTASAEARAAFESQFPGYRTDPLVSWQQYSKGLLNEYQERMNGGRGRRVEAPVPALTGWQHVERWSAQAWGVPLTITDAEMAPADLALSALRRLVMATASSVGAQRVVRVWFSDEAVGQHTPTASTASAEPQDTSVDEKQPPSVAPVKAPAQQPLTRAVLEATAAAPGKLVVGAAPVPFATRLTNLSKVKFQLTP